VFSSVLTFVCACLVARAAYRRSGSWLATILVFVATWLFLPTLARAVCNYFIDIALPLWPLLVIVIVLLVIGRLRYLDQVDRLSRRFPPRQTSAKLRRDE
jgi:hypothetical protein